MTAAHRRYLLTEAGVSAAINAVLSVAFVLLVFGRLARVDAAALVRDAAPQSFMIALMATAVPTLLTRRRLRARAVAPMPPARLRLPANTLARALLVAVAVTLVSVGVQALLLPALLPAGARFGAVLAGKAIGGGLLGASVTIAALRVALGDRN